MLILQLAQWTLLCSICTAFRSTASSDESRVAAIPKQYVVDSLVDVTRIFGGLTRVSVQGSSATFKCCKSRPDELGILVDEAGPKTHELLQGCRGLVGLSFRSFTRYEPNHPENARCLVAESGMPQAFLQFSFPANTVRVVGELVDVSDALMKQQSSVTMPSGRTFRCCMKEDGRHAYLVAQQKNKFDGTVLQRLQDNIGAFSNKKCAGLLGVGYHSWNKWTGNRCLVLSSRIPQEAMQVLGWTLQPTITEESLLPEETTNPEEATPTGNRQLNKQESSITDEIEEAEAVKIDEEVAEDTVQNAEQEEQEPVSSSNAPLESQEEQEPVSSSNDQDGGEAASSWQLAVRVVDATSGNTLKSVPIQILNKKKTVLAEGETSQVGMATVNVAQEEDVVFLAISRQGYMAMKRRYIRSRQCGGGDKCITQCALSPTF